MLLLQRLGPQFLTSIARNIDGRRVIIKRLFIVANSQSVRQWRHQAETADWRPPPSARCQQSNNRNYHKYKEREGYLLLFRCRHPSRARRKQRKEEISINRNVTWSFLCTPVSPSKNPDFHLSNPNQLNSLHKHQQLKPIPQSNHFMIDINLFLFQSKSHCNLSIGSPFILQLNSINYFNQFLVHSVLPHVSIEIKIKMRLEIKNRNKNLKLK